MKIGQKHTEEQKRKISNTMKGMKRSEQYKDKFRGENNPMWGKRGKDSPNWKGGFSAKIGNTRARFLFLLKYNFTCQYCGRKAPEIQFHIDHIFPKSKGGKSNEENLILACDECNLGKGDLIINR